MKPKSSLLSRALLHTTYLTFASIGAVQAQITVDGTRDGSDTGYTENAVQGNITGWDSNNVLANLHTAQDGVDLALFLGGRSQGNAFIIFIDSKAGGTNFIPNNLITSGGDESTINNLGTSPTAGLTFESGFTADYAIRIFGDGGGGTGAFVNRYDLQTGVRNFVGEAGTTSPAASGFVSEVRVNWAEVTTAYNLVADGVELKLNIAALGVPTGTAQPVKLMAILLNGGSDYASNQVLATRTSSTADIAGGINSIDFETEADIQTISLTVDNVDTDGDGMPNDTDPDDDNDMLLDTVETNDGNYVDANATGTDPLVANTDGDAGNDFEEINSPFTFGFLTDPNVANYATMAMPGDFNGWDVTGASFNGMTRVGTSLAEQNTWTLEFEFFDPGNIEYKFAADGSYINSWGDGANNYVTAIPASGIHTITFDNVTLAHSIVRTVFPDVASYLAAYGLTAGSDEDGDNILNENEFTANTDPYSDDSDGDGEKDNVDPEPLVALIQARDIEFSVDMNFQISTGSFNVGTDTVVVDFFDGAAGPLPDLALTDPDTDGIYTGSLTAFEGNAGTSFGTYKFKTDSVGAPDGGFEGAIDNRTFDLGVKDVTQVLPTVFFNDISSLYALWASTNAGGQASDLDFDGDNVENGIEYFMGETGSSFTPSPVPVNGVVTWAHDSNATDATFRVLTSTDFVNWMDNTGDAVDAGGFVTYTLPTMQTKIFVQLEVTIP